jgi:hypothetical protein
MQNPASLRFCCRAIQQSLWEVSPSAFFRWGAPALSATDAVEQIFVIPFEASNLTAASSRADVAASETILLEEACALFCRRFRRCFR